MTSYVYISWSCKQIATLFVQLFTNCTQIIRNIEHRLARLTQSLEKILKLHSIRILLTVRDSVRLAV